MSSFKLFSGATKNLSKGSDIIGTLKIRDKKIKLKTFNYNEYNFFPDMSNPYKRYYQKKPKILHFFRYGSIRRIKYAILPAPLRRIWISMIVNDYYGSSILKNLNYLFNKALRILQLLGYKGC